MKALTQTNFLFQGQTDVYHGKVRDVYFLGDEMLCMVATDRISAFDVILPEGIPYKGQILNQIAAKFLNATRDIIPNWLLATPDPMVSVGYRCKGYPVEMIVRGYLCGSAWRAYKAGVREICGVRLPDGMHENEPFPSPIITPTTKAEIGTHDEDISREEIIARGLVPAKEYEQIEQYALALFARGQQIAAQHGLILVDTKYEFGQFRGKVMLMDEVHTPDSSRYFYAHNSSHKVGESNLADSTHNSSPKVGESNPADSTHNSSPKVGEVPLAGEGYEAHPRQLSKEFVREWLMSNGFQGRPGQQVPEMTPAIVSDITDRYIELFEGITGDSFVREDTSDLAARIARNVNDYLAKL